MCQDVEHGGKRCEVTNRTRKMAALRRQIQRIALRLESEDITVARRNTLSLKLMNAAVSLQEARDTKDDTLAVITRPVIG